MKPTMAGMNVQKKRGRSRPRRCGRGRTCAPRTCPGRSRAAPRRARVGELLVQRGGSGHLLADAALGADLGAEVDHLAAGEAVLRGRAGRRRGHGAGRGRGVRRLAGLHRLGPQRRAGAVELEAPAGGRAHGPNGPTGLRPGQASAAHAGVAQVPGTICATRRVQGRVQGVWGESGAPGTGSCPDRERDAPGGREPRSARAGVNPPARTAARP